MEFFILLPFLVVALTFHEFAHAYVAYKLGDATPKMQGRVTLNPLAHLDPMGTAVLIISSLAGFGFGWGKPVSFNPYNLKHPKRDTGLIAAAGPLANIILAAIAFLVLFLIKVQSFPNALDYSLSNNIFLSLLVSTLIPFILINCILATFNLIPIYPLDGFNVTMALLPKGLSEQFSETAKYGVYALILLMITGATRVIISPVISFVMGIINLVIG